MADLPPYALKRSFKSRTIRVSVSYGGKVKVSAPYLTTKRSVDSFLHKHIDWLHKKIKYFKKFTGDRLTRGQEKKLFVIYKKKALAVSTAKVFEHNKYYNFSYSIIAVRNSRSRWGSCSSKGTLSFNYKIAFLPERLADYLVVHELCHLKERNHGKSFWNLVIQRMPDYVSRRKALREFERTFKFPGAGI